MTLVNFKRPYLNKQGENQLAYNSPLANLFDSFFANEILGKEHASFMPAVNVSNEEGNYHIEFSAPGFDKDDFKLEINQGTLTVSGSHKTEKEVKEKNFVRKEFSQGSFQRSFTLPEEVNAEAIEAKYENGILKVNLPKKVETEKSKIEIKVS